MASLSDPVRISHLRQMARSAAHYRVSVEQGREQTPGMRFGKLVHAVMLSQPYTVFEGERRGNRWSSFQEEHPEELIATRDEFERAVLCCDAIEAHPEALPRLLGEAEAERRFTTIGRACIGHIDVLGASFVTELKTASTTQPDQFLRGALRLQYHAQLAWYLDGIGHPDWPAHIVAVETAPPFAVSVFTLSPRTIEAGRRCYRLWMEQLLVCEASGRWPAYCESVVPFDVPDQETTLIIDGEEVAA